MSNVGKDVVVIYPKDSDCEKADGEACTFRSNAEQGVQYGSRGMIGQRRHMNFKNEQRNDDREYAIAKSFDARSTFNSLRSRELAQGVPSGLRNRRPRGLNAVSLTITPWWLNIFSGSRSAE